MTYGFPDAVRRAGKAILSALLLSACSGSDADGDRLAGAEAPIHPCTADATITVTRVGGLYLRMPADSVRLLCPVGREIDVREPTDGTVFVIDPQSEPVSAWSYNNRVVWIEVASPRFETADGLRVGLPLSRLLDVEGLQGTVGDAPDFYVFSSESGPHCGLAFRIDRQTARALSGSDRTTLDNVGAREALQRFGGSGRVTEILVLGDDACSR